MTLLICPGFHSPELTDQFLSHLRPHLPSRPILVYPAHRYLPHNSLAVLQFLQKHCPSGSLSVVAFSAGVVGGLGALLSGRVRSLFALDGWGVPLGSTQQSTVYRLSHDWFTHWSSHELGGGSVSFYADPPVEHLDLWTAPDKVQGWHLEPEGRRWRTTALEFLVRLI
ncbi:hypothetical protein [Leptolyngbya sp. FACHB-261]|uniref:hypothetical protein n=1 Tax=Leptolyngbya sp. FACHB-261 TaxID=2692806 RepID=UPI001684142D|nr:hypothetical protein [Leptolyngbya sp. FACHB-261]MBD2103335.1 hypothetical protein [Leptolyngbya sp. FACHB-261]